MDWPAGSLVRCCQHWPQGSPGGSPDLGLPADQALPLLAVATGAALVCTDERLAPADGIGAVLRYPDMGRHPKFGPSGTSAATPFVSLTTRPSADSPTSGIAEQRKGSS